MAYSTPAMVRLALIPFSNQPAGYSGEDPPTEPTNTGADLSNLQLLDAIAEADSVIDSYIGKYYAVPVALVTDANPIDPEAPDMVGPHPIDYWSRNIAAYNATLSIRESQDFADTDPVARRYNATMTALTLVSKGLANLQLPNNTSGTSATGAGSAVNPYVGDLFDPRDFSLRPINPAWPFWPDIPSGWGPW